MELKLTSGSIALDRQKESMSFQDITMTYGEIVETAVSSTPGAYCICTAGEGEKPVYPVIQYAETDWEFAKRLASRINTVLYPEVCRSGPYIWLGIPDCGGSAVRLNTEEYTHGISSYFYELGGAAMGWKRSDFEYYKVECSENIKVGMNIEYAGGIWKALEKHARLERGELRFTYLLGRDAITSVKKAYNPLFAGRSIHGTVIKAEGDTVRLHLAIDESQPVASAYPYRWVPDTGSVMYCMPEKGTTVSLYFPDEDEGNAAAISCVRYNGASCKGMADTSKRTLTTAAGKRLYLNPATMGLNTGDSGHIVSMGDKTGITVGSGKSIYISAVGGVWLAAEKIRIKTPDALNMLRVSEQ